MPVIEGSQSKYSTVSLEKNLPPQALPRAEGSDITTQPWLRPHSTWLSGLAIITYVQVQAGNEQMVGGLFHIKVLKVLAEAVAAIAAAALAATKCLGPRLLGTGCRRSDLHVKERKTRSPDPDRLLCKLFQSFSPA